MYGVGSFFGRRVLGRAFLRRSVITTGLVREARARFVEAVNALVVVAVDTAMVCLVLMVGDEAGAARRRVP